MSGFIIEIGSFSILWAVFWRLLAAGFYVFVITRAIQELLSLDVKNGLRKLAWKLVWTSSILFFINTAGLSLIVIQPFLSMDSFNFVTQRLSDINSVGFFVVGYIKYKIYTQQYTPEQKEFHSRLDTLEKKRDQRDVRRNVARLKLNKKRRDKTIQKRRRKVK